jgi:hypothetical protein
MHPKKPEEAWRLTFTVADAARLPSGAIGVGDSVIELGVTAAGDAAGASAALASTGPTAAIDIEARINATRARRVLLIDFI